MGGPAVGVSDGVVDVAVNRGPIATGEPARQIPAADKVGQRLRRDVAGFGCRIGRMHHQAAQYEKCREGTEDEFHGVTLSVPNTDTISTQRDRFRFP